MINNVSSGSNAFWPCFGITKKPPASNFQPSGSDTILDGTALVSAGFRVPGGGWISASVFKADSFSEDNPVMLVRGIDVCGTKFEKEININDVNLRNASIIQMLALDGYFAANGKPASTTRAFVGAMGAKEASGAFDGTVNIFSQFNFVEILQNLMRNFIANQCRDGTAWLGPILDTLLNHEQRA